MGNRMNGQIGLQMYHARSKMKMADISGEYSWERTKLTAVCLGNTLNRYGSHDWLC